MFKTVGDREAYLGYLRAYAAKRGLAIWAYCLMTNHVHLVPEREESLGEVRYVGLNPVRAGMVEQADDYRW